MANDDEAGARAAAEYFLELHAYLFESGDVTLWDSMCEAESMFCADARTAAADNFAAGYRQSGGAMTFTVSEVISPDATVEYYEVVGNVDVAPYEIVGPDGAVVRNGEAETDLSATVYLSAAGPSDWRVRAAVIGAER